MIARMPDDCCVADYSSLINVTNDEIAADLYAIAELLEGQRANPFRVDAYRHGADTLMTLRRPAHEILDNEGVAGLVALPTIGTTLASVIEERIVLGHSTVLDRLRGDAMVERAFASVPGIGMELAARIHEQLGIDTLEELETAAHNGTLQQVSGMGRGRVLAVRESLAGRLTQRRQHDADSLFTEEAADTATLEKVAVPDILSIDAEYRRRATANELVRIAPKRFNPAGRAWLPILHTERHGQHFSALFSNTARAHQLGRTDDWVIVHHDDKGNGQWTVVTQRRGKLKGKRVVRGREIESAQYYRNRKPVKPK